MVTMTAKQALPASRLRLYNLGMGVLHAIQAVAVLALGNEFTLPVIGTFMTGPPGVEPVIEPLFEVSVAWGVAVFLLISAAAHFVISMPGVFRWYLRNLENKRNYARWIEYSLSSSVMVVLIAMLVGIADIAALLAIAGVNASMILFGLLQEHYERPGRPGWSRFSRRAAGLRLRDLRVALRVLQLVRGEHGPAVSPHRSVAQLPLRRVRVRGAQPCGEVRACLAGLRQHPRSVVAALSPTVR